MVAFDKKKEVEHLTQVLRETQQALRDGNVIKLQELSDQTIHSASIYQHTDFITIAVLIYTLNKLLLRKDKLNLKNWAVFIKKFNSEIDTSLKDLNNEDNEEFARHIQHARELVSNLSPTAKTNVEEVLHKASLNKATKIYEHGISLSRTAQLLGVTPWELAEYIGSRNMHDNPYNAAVDIKKRAKLVLDFFK